VRKEINNTTDRSKMFKIVMIQNKKPQLTAVSLMIVIDVRTESIIHVIKMISAVVAFGILAEAKAQRPPV
jgi:hypothetical protein